MNIFKQPGSDGKKHPFIYRDQATMEVRSGGGCLSIFGLPFLLAGLFFMQVPLGIIPIKNATGTPSIFIILFGSVFAAVGAALVFGRSGIILDRATGRIIQWYGLLVPMKRKEYLLDAVDQVEMNFSSGDSESPATWPIKLTGNSLPQAVSVLQPASFAEARQLAEELSRFLRKPLADSSAGERIIRDPDHLNESYRDRMRRTGKSAFSLPPEPAGRRSRVEQTGEGFIINISAPPKNFIHYLPVFAPLIFAAIFILFFLPNILTRPHHDFFNNIFFGFFCLFIAVPVLSALYKMYRQKKWFERITVTPAVLRVEALKQGKSTTEEIPIDELEDLIAPATQGAVNAIEVPGMKKVSLGDTGTPRMPDGRPVPRFLVSLMAMVGTRGIIARSDKTVIEFAGGLEKDEIAWIYALIRKKIAES